MSSNNLDTLYRQVIMDHYKHPRNKGTLEGETLTAEMNNPSCGDRILLQFKVSDGRVEDVKFDGEGCSISMSSASMMTQAIKGKKISDRKSTRLNFSHVAISYAVFCLKK